MSRYMQDRCLEIANLEPVTILEELIELAAVPLELGAGIEDLAEDLLHPDNLAANRERAPEFGLQ
ncbi:hypothetical protein D9M72_496050 [compost metagenome]